MRWAAVILLAVLVAGGTYYVIEQENEGPAEQFGEKVDDAVKDLNPDGAAEKIGEDIDRAVEDATN